MAEDFGKLWERGFFPRTQKILKEIAVTAKEGWTQATLAFSPNWWGRMAISKQSGGGGGFIVRKAIGGYEIHYANKGKYNYLAVVERGRDEYDMKPKLLASPRARMGKNGRYVIVPLSKNEDGSRVSPKNNEINSLMTKIGTKKEPNADGKIVTRNKYQYSREEGMTGQKNSFETRQTHKDGSIQRSYHKFVMVSEKSERWIHPAIQGAKNQEKIQAVVDKAIKSKVLKTAIATDVKSLILGLTDKYSKK